MVWLCYGQKLPDSLKCVELFARVEIVEHADYGSYVGPVRSVENVETKLLGRFLIPLIRTN